MSGMKRWFAAVAVAATALCAGGCYDEFVDERFDGPGFGAVGVVEGRPTTRPLVEAGEGRLKEGDVVRLGAWNIQWLDSSEGGRRPQRAEDLAEYIASSKVDALGVSEIGARVIDGVWQSATLNRVVDLLSSTTGGHWQYLLFPNANDDLRQLVGVLWNGDRVQMLGWMAAEIDRSRDARIWHRHPVGVKFSAGRGLVDVVMIPIHMKCCIAADQRAEEARTLVAALPALLSYFRDNDVFIIGDANMFDHDETAGRIYRGAGFTDLNARDRATHVQGFSFDRAYVPRQPEFEGARLGVFGREFVRPRDLKWKEFQERYSDHLLVWIDVPVVPDDDR
jgi:hypothetical protein